MTDKERPSEPDIKKLLEQGAANVNKPRTMPKVSEIFPHGFEENEKACVREEDSKPISSFYGENIKRSEEDKCQLALECVISDIEDCANELKAIDYLQHRSVSYVSMCVDYFKGNKGLDLYSRREQLLNLILMRVKELEERVL